MNITNKADIEILRLLGRQIAELAESSANKQKKASWTRISDLDCSAGPLSLVHLWPLAWSEVLPDETFLRCESENARQIERTLRQRIFSATQLFDDSVIEPVVTYPHFINIVPYPDLPVSAHYVDDDHAKTGAFKFESPVMEMSKICAGSTGTRKQAETGLNEIFDGRM